MQISKASSFQPQSTLQRGIASFVPQYVRRRTRAANEADRSEDDSLTSTLASSSSVMHSLRFFYTRACHAYPPEGIDAAVPDVPTIVGPHGYQSEFCGRHATLPPVECPGHHVRSARSTEGPAA